LLAYICKVTKKFCFKEKEKENKLVLGMCWAMESFLVKCGGIFFKGLGKEEESS
jgi:hypothetical protein